MKIERAHRIFRSRLPPFRTSVGTVLSSVVVVIGIASIGCVPTDESPGAIAKTAPVAAPAQRVVVVSSSQIPDRAAVAGIQPSAPVTRPSTGAPGVKPVERGEPAINLPAGPSAAARMISNGAAPKQSTPISQVGQRSLSQPGSSPTSALPASTAQQPVVTGNGNAPGSAPALIVLRPERPARIGPTLNPRAIGPLIRDRSPYGGGYMRTDSIDPRSTRATDPVFVVSPGVPRAAPGQRGPAAAAQPGNKAPVELKDDLDEFAEGSP